MTKTLANRPDVYARVTDKIVADLDKGVRPWMRPWNADHAAGRITRPLRHSGIPYKGHQRHHALVGGRAEGLQLPLVADLQTGA